MHVGEKESTDNAKLLPQPGDPPGQCRTYSDSAPLGVVGQQPQRRRLKNRGGDSASGLTRCPLTARPCHPVLCRLPRSASDAPAVSDGHMWPLGYSIRKARLHGAAISRAILSALFTHESQTITVLGPKMSSLPKAVLFCIWRKKLNVDRRKSEVTSLGCL